MLITGRKIQSYDDMNRAPNRAVEGGTGGHAMNYNRIEIEPVSSALGAEISRVDLSTPLADATYLEIRQALSEYGVIFFRDQKLTPEQYVAFGERFGELKVSAVIPLLPGHPKIAELRKEPDQRTNIGDKWHTDQAYRDVPTMGTILLAREVPARGGDTLFINMSSVFETLSEGMQRTLEGMRALHSHAFILQNAGAHGSDHRFVDIEKGNEVAVHPVVTRHPETGRKVLFVNPGYTVRFEGWTQSESESLLNYLYQRAQRPEFGCRFRWREGSIAFWDNRQTWHYAANDYHGQRRVMHRLVVA
jgi:taurine dioxygenase